MIEDTDEEWMAEYLRLEYGEEKDDPNSLKSSDLVFVGTFVVDGIPTKYWSYPTSGEPMWGTIAEDGDNAYASMTSTPPPKANS